MSGVGIGPIEEEPWEADVGAALRALPTVEPPAGFIDAALDHRPRFAGRAMVGLSALTIAGLALAAALGLVERTSTPPVDELVARHDTVVRAGILSGNPLGTEVDYRIETPVEMPDGFHRTGNLAVEDIRQAVYARDGEEEVSIFVEDGRIGWEALPADGLVTIDGRNVWVDPDREVAVLAAGDQMVTIIGLPTDELGNVLASLPDPDRGLAERARDLAEAIVVQLGYSPTG